MFASMVDRSKLVHLLKPNFSRSSKDFPRKLDLGGQKVIETPETDSKKRHGFPAACPMTFHGS